MTCQSLLSPAPACFHAGTTVAAAIDALLSTGASALPVVDAAGRYKGMFGLHEVMAMMLPAAATLNHEIDQINWLTEGRAAIAERLASHGKQTVGSHMAAEPGLPFATSAAEALLLLYRGRQVLAVVDESGKLAGIISPADAIRRIKES